MSEASLLSAMRAFFVTEGVTRKYIIAFSGGLDSQVLLSLCHALRDELSLQISVVHINHQLHAQSHEWTITCKNTCDALNIPFKFYSTHINLQIGESLEEKARQCRYKMLATHMKEDDVLLTAHHANDQVETVLLQLLRGAGPKGLAAMPPLKSFAKGWHARPLLNFSRDHLYLYAVEKKLTWIEDDSNYNQKYARNFIRHTLLPLLIQRYPGSVRAVARSAAHCGENEFLLAEYAQGLLQKVEGSTKHSLSASKLLSLTQAQQRLVLRTFICNAKVILPNTKKMLSIQTDFLLAAQDKQPSISWGNVSLKRYRDDIFLLQNKEKILISLPLSWDLQKDLLLPAIGCLQSKRVQGSGISADINAVSVTLRQGGEKIEMPNRGGAHCLKKLFQEWNVPPWERDSIPLIYVAGKLIAIANYYLNQNYAAKNDTWGNEIIFTKV